MTFFDKIKTRPYLFTIIAGVTIVCSCNRQVNDYAVGDIVKKNAEAFAPDEIQLKGYGIFRHAMNKDKEWLLSLEPDRFLSRFLTQAGLEPKAEGYYGWEAGAASGHCLGHYLSACSMAYAADNDIRFKERTDYIVSELQRCQEARGTGYVGAMAEENRFWKEISEGDIRTDGWSLNGGWVPWYTIHKLWAGLIDVVKYTGNPQAKEVLVALTDWSVSEFGHLTEEQFQYMHKSEFGGMNESFAEVYALTGNKDYLTMADNFHHHAIIDPLAEGIDSLAGLHSNTQVPKLVGEARYYELTGDKSREAAASYYWDSMVYHHSYVNGGNSNFERVSKRDSLNKELSETTSETCNTYNMLKLTEHLFSWYAEGKYMDYYERAMYNHILASQNPENGMVCYSVSLAQGGHKVFSTPFDSFWCCVGTGMENHTRYAKNIFYKSPEDNGVYINLFVPSVLNSEEKGIEMSIDTDFPYSDEVTVTFGRNTGKMPLYIRCPMWVDGNMEVTLNGNKIENVIVRDSYLKINRRWKSSDVLKIVLPMSIRTESMPDNPARQALFYGPVLLAAPLGTAPDVKIPEFAAASGNAAENVSIKDRKRLVFSAKTKDGEICDLVPFYSIYDTKYNVYFDVCDK